MCTKKEALNDAMNKFAEDLWLMESMKRPDFALLPIMASTCPFCAYQKAMNGGNLVCTGCEYARNHGGSCDEDGSAWLNIKRGLNNTHSQDMAFWSTDLGGDKLIQFRVLVSTTAAALRKVDSLDEFMKLKVNFLASLLRINGKFEDIACLIERTYW